MSKYRLVATVVLAVAALCFAAVLVLPSNDAAEHIDSVDVEYTYTVSDDGVSPPDPDPRYLDWSKNGEKWEITFIGMPGEGFVIIEDETSDVSIDVMCKDWHPKLKVKSCRDVTISGSYNVLDVTDKDNGKGTGGIVSIDFYPEKGIDSLKVDCTTTTIKSPYIKTINEGGTIEINGEKVCYNVDYTTAGLVKIIAEESLSFSNCEKVKEQKFETPNFNVRSDATIELDTNITIECTGEKGSVSIIGDTITGGQSGDKDLKCTGKSDAGQSFNLKGSKEEGSKGEFKNVQISEYSNVTIDIELEIFNLDIKDVGEDVIVEKSVVLTDTPYEDETPSVSINGDSLLVEDIDDGASGKFEIELSGDLVIISGKLIGYTASISGAIMLGSGSIDVDGSLTISGSLENGDSDYPYIHGGTVTFNGTIFSASNEDKGFGAMCIAADEGIVFEDISDCMLTIKPEMSPGTSNACVFTDSGSIEFKSCHNFSLCFVADTSEGLKGLYNVCENGKEDTISFVDSEVSLIAMYGEDVEEGDVDNLVLMLADAEASMGGTIVLGDIAGTDDVRYCKELDEETFIEMSKFIQGETNAVTGSAVTIISESIEPVPEPGEAKDYTMLAIMVGILVIVVALSLIAVVMVRKK